MATSSRRIRIVNPDLSGSERLILDADYSSGTSLTVKSNYGVQDNDILVIEQPNSEKCEASSVASTTGNTTVTLDSAFKFAHQKGSIIYRSEYNQVEISYRTSSTGDWTVLDTIGIKWDDQETLKIHQGATNDYQYRFRFKNSASGNYSEYSQTQGGGGFSYNQIGKLVEDVRSIIIDPDRKIVSDQQIISFLEEGKKIIQAKKNDWWFWYKIDEGTITTVANQRKYNLDDISTGIEYVKDVRFRNQATDDVLYPLKYEQEIIFDQYVTDQDEDSDDEVRRYTILPGDSSSTAGYINVDPAPENTGNGSFYVRYYEPDSQFSSVADTTAIPIPGILVNYAVYKCEQIKGQDSRADRYYNKFLGPPTMRKADDRLTGIALLEQMQIGKLKAIGQPKQLKYFRGRRAMSRLYDTVGENQEYIAENYFSYPEK